MGVIPEFQRQRLASSVVGTAGVDTSGAKIGESIAGAAESIQKPVMNLAVQRQESKDAALANNTLIGFDMALNKAYSEHQSEYQSFQGDKMDRVKAFQTKSEELFKSTLDATPSAAARDLVEKHGFAVQKTYIDREMESADKNQAALAYTNTMNSVDLLGQKAEMIGKDAGLTLPQKLARTQELLNQGQTTYAAAYSLLSPENRTKLEKGIPETISKSLLYANFDSNPDDTKKMLASGLFDKFLSTEDRTKLQKQADVWTERLADRDKEMHNQAVLVQQDTTSADFAARMVGPNPPSLAEIEKAHILGAGKLPGGINEQDYHTYVDARTQPIKEGAPAEKAQALSDLADKFFAIGDAGGKDVKGDANFSQVAAFRQAAILAHQMKARTDTQFSEDLATSQKAFQNGVSDTVSQAHKNGAAVWQYHKNWLQQYNSFNYLGTDGKMTSVKVDKSEVEGAKAYLGSQLMTYMAKYDIPSDKIPQVAQSILSSYLISKHPELAGKSEIPNMIMDAETSFRHLYGGTTAYKPDFMVAPPADAAMVIMTAPDGTQVPVHPSKVEEAKARGLR